MFTIIIGEEGEYGRRLRKYLETHWTGSLRLHSFTTPEALLDSEERADCWLIDEVFFKILKEKQKGTSDNQDRCILLTAEEKEGCFCRYHPPGELMEMIRERRRIWADASAMGRQNCSLTAVYSPVFDPKLTEIAASFMKAGDLYLGMEDVGEVGREKGNMGDLCYYIGLHSEGITERVRETAKEENGIWRVASPRLYFDLLELAPEEYQWFFQCLKECGQYGDIYVGLGSGILAVLPLDQMFDRFFLIDSHENVRQHFSCDSLEQALRSDARCFHGIYERRYREEVLYAEVQ